MLYAIIPQTCKSDQAFGLISVLVVQAIFSHLDNLRVFLWIVVQQPSMK